MTPHFTRSIRLIRPSLQLRLIGTFGAICGLALLTQALVLGALLNRVAGTMPSDAQHLARSIPSLVLSALGLSLALVLPALLLIGVRVTFRIAGPLYRMERHLAAVARGERPEPCSIRRTDHLQDFCQTMNAALAAAEHRSDAQDSPPPTLRAAA
jgi:hypothetical protein